jgi:hypothetical protein
MLLSYSFVGFSFFVVTRERERKYIMDGDAWNKAPDKSSIREKVEKQHLHLIFYNLIDGLVASFDTSKLVGVEKRDDKRRC